MIRAALLALLAGPAAAGMSDETALAELRACLGAGKAGTGAACIGGVSERCRAVTAGGETTLGIVECALTETRAWDALLNEEYRATRDWARDMDRATAEHSPEFANRAQSLLEAQRAWIAFRDAECGLAYALWGSGSLRTVAGANCRMEMTAERTLALREMRGEGM